MLLEKIPKTSVIHDRWELMEISHGENGYAAERPTFIRTVQPHEPIDNIHCISPNHRDLIDHYQVEVFVDRSVC